MKESGLALKYIENPKEEMYLYSIKYHAYSIEFVPKKNQSFEIVQAFFDFDWSKLKSDKDYCYKYLSKKFITKDQALIMIQDNLKYIKLISRNIQKELIEMKLELEKYLSKEKIEEDIDDFF